MNRSMARVGFDVNVVNVMESNCLFQQMMGYGENPCIPALPDAV